MADAEATGQITECRRAVTGLHTPQYLKYVVFDIYGHT